MCWSHPRCGRTNIEETLRDNIVFFAEIMAEIETCKCYLVSFEYSRLDETNASTENALDTKFNLYRHPECQGLSFESDEDIISVGVRLD